MVIGYDINFVAIIIYDMHELVFRETTTLPFPYLVQLLCDEDHVTEIFSINSKVEAMGMAQTSIINDSNNLILG